MDEEIKVVVLTNGRSVIFKSGGVRWEDVMFIDAVPSKETGNMVLNFMPVAAFAEDPTTLPFNESQILTKYNPAPDVIRIYKMFLIEFSKNREQAKAAKEAARQQSVKNNVVNFDKQE